MFKEKLIEESKKIELAIELDDIFESANLSPETQKSFAVVFETAVKKRALAIAESHIETVAENAKQSVETEVAEKTKTIEENLKAEAEDFLSHLAETWLADNKVAIDKGIKSDLFESFFDGMKTMFIEHNVVLPAESVDVVAEMESELDEAKTETARMYESQKQTKAEFDEYKRSVVIEKATADLTESQKLKVVGLLEGVPFGDGFDAKLTAMVEMASMKNDNGETKTLDESAKEGENLAGLNYQTTVIDESKTENPKSQNNGEPLSEMDQFAQALDADN